MGYAENIGFIWIERKHFTQGMRRKIKKPGCWTLSKISLGTFMCPQKHIRTLSSIRKHEEEGQPHRVSLFGGFLKWWYPTTMGFPTKNDYFGVFWGYHHSKKHPFLPQSHINNLRMFFQDIWVKSLQVELP